MKILRSHPTLTHYDQLTLATEIAPGDERLERLELLSNSRRPTKEAESAKLFWRIYADHVAETDGFLRRREGDGPNPLLNYGYAVLLSTILQNLFAVGLDPTFGICHAIRERSTPLAYDLMEPFRPCVDWRVALWIRKNPESRTRRSRGSSGNGLRDSRWRKLIGWNSRSMCAA